MSLRICSSMKRVLTMTFACVFTVVPTPSAHADIPRTESLDLHDMVLATARSVHDFWQDKGVDASFVVRQVPSPVTCPFASIGSASTSAFCGKLRPNEFRYAPELFQMVRNQGELSAVLTVAHEVGHAVENTVGYFPESGPFERGANCMAGVYARDNGVSLDTAMEAFRHTLMHTVPGGDDSLRDGYQATDPVRDCTRY